MICPSINLACTRALRRSLRALSLRQFKVFAAVARDLSYARAAAELQVSQPAVSMQMRQIEQAIRMVLTEPAGHRPQATSKPSVM